MARQRGQEHARQDAKYAVSTRPGRQSCSLGRHFLLTVGEAKLPVKNVGYAEHGHIRIPNELLLNGGDDCDLADLIDYVYADMPENPTLEYYPDRALLAPYNDDGTSLNDAVLDRLPG